MLSERADGMEGERERAAVASVAIAQQQNWSE